jgi:RNA polymerase sigma-70 factor, ECF subfamily
MFRSSGVYLRAKLCNYLANWAVKMDMNAVVEPMDRELDGLLPLIATGDRRAFGRLYDLASPKLFAVVRCVLKKPELAEEALQEAFMKIWQRAATYEAGSVRPMAWLAAIARNQAIDIRRRFAERMSATAVELDEANSVSVMPEAELAMQLTRLKKCLSSLPSERQDMVLLAYYQGWTRDELAAQYKKPATTIKTLLRRSLTVLKECLDGKA